MDCVKIFASVYDVKPIGFRLLQYNLVNSSGEPWMADQVVDLVKKMISSCKPLVQNSVIK